jgi:hypothetical protein
VHKGKGNLKIRMAEEKIAAPFTNKHFMAELTIDQHLEDNSNLN